MTPLSEELSAPAKLNLTLRVVGRRADGYHLVDSLMVPVNLYDVVGVTVAAPTRQSPRITVTSDSPDAPGGPGNLAYRASALFLQEIGKEMVVTVDIRKRIPVGSGLGGGSSDAAAVLLALNRLLNMPLPSERLSALGAELGADVGFFLHGRPARAQGVGEQIQPVVLPRSLTFVICSDGYVLSTKSVYARLDLSLTTRGHDSNINAFTDGRIPIEELLVNDLEWAAAQIHPQVLALKARLLQEGAVGALMSGSGSAVFGVWPSLRAAQAAARRLRQSGLWAEAVQALNMSPAVRV